MGLLGLPVEPDTLHGVLRLSLRLTRCHEAAQAFASLGGPRLLLGLTQASAFSGFASLASLLVRHVVEEPPTLAHAMDKVARTMTAGGNSPMSSKELHYVLRVLGPAACRDADLFREVATSVLRISLLPMSKRGWLGPFFVVYGLPPGLQARGLGLLAAKTSLAQKSVTPQIVGCFWKGVFIVRDGPRIQ